MSFRAPHPFRQLTARKLHLVKKHMGLPYSIARKCFSGAPRRKWADIDAAALYGLCWSAAHYDPTTGHAFSTYATRCIWGIICRHLKLENKHAIARDRPIYSIDYEMHTAHGIPVTHAETIEGDEDTVEEAMRGEYAEYTQKLLSKLHGRERLVIEMRYGIGCAEHTLIQVGALLGVTRERVRQLERRALEKMRCASLRISLDAHRRVG